MASLVTNLDKAGNASLTYFKGLMHAGDARLCAENENWVPAVVSLYHAVFDLTLAVMLASEHDLPVDYQGTRLPLSEAIDRGADPYHFIGHAEILRFAQREMERDLADALERLQELTLFTSSHPRRSVLPDGTRWINTCGIVAPQFIRTVQQEVRRLETYFQLFRNHLREQARANPDQEAFVLADVDIEQHPEEPIQKLGCYRSERAVALAREIHTAVFPYTRPS